MQKFWVYVWKHNFDKLKDGENEYFLDLDKNLPWHELPATKRNIKSCKFTKQGIGLRFYYTLPYR